MLPVLLLAMPPTICGGGYACFTLGQKSYCSMNNKAINSDNISSTTNFLLGSSTVIATYALISTQFPKEKVLTTDVTPDELKTKKFIPIHKQSKNSQFQPPKTAKEAFQRFGRPFLIRAGAAGVGFFFAGITTSIASSRCDS